MRTEFLNRCLSYNFLPQHIANQRIGVYLHSNKYIARLNKHKHTFALKVLKTEIGDNYRHLRYLRHEINIHYSQICKHLPIRYIQSLELLQDRRLSRIFRNTSGILCDKLRTLIEKKYHASREQLRTYEYFAASNNCDVRTSDSPLGRGYHDLTFIKKNITSNSNTTVINVKLDPNDFNSEKHQEYLTTMKNGL